jgi:DNA-binding CsgD family transcriptional regulator
MAGGSAWKKTSPARDPATGKIKKGQARPEWAAAKVKSWKRAWDAAIADQLCDRLVREHRLDPKLMDVIYNGPAPKRQRSRRAIDERKKPPDRPIFGHDGKVAKKPTDAQLEAVALWAEGNTYREIGEKLYLTVSGVELRMKRAMMVTGAKSPGHLVALSIRAGWIP